MGERGAATLEREQERQQERARVEHPNGVAPLDPRPRQLALLPEAEEGQGAGRNGIAAGWLTARTPAEAVAPGVPDPLALEVGAAIAERRERRKMSQAELAQALGCSRSAVSRWEMGLRLPSVPHLVAIGRALGCGARELLPE